MKLVTPAYFRRFECIADKCKDNCCIGWEIDIDDQTADLYKKTKGTFGNRLDSSITYGSPNAFILDANDRCPFLNNNNLCDIITSLGKNSLCQICRDHPRYYEWYDGIKEGGIGLCCEEAARIILSEKNNSFYTEEISYESCSLYDTQMYSCLYQARNIIISHLSNNNIPVSRRICDVLEYCEQLQNLTDNNEFTVPDMISARNSGHSDIRPVLDFLIHLEPINEQWPAYISKIIKMYDKISETSFSEKEFSVLKGYLQNIMIYFVWRYFLKGTFDGEFLSKIKFAAVSTAVISYMFSYLKFMENFSLKSCADAAKDYSKEMEYSEENMEAFADASYDEQFFSTEKIKGLFF